MAAKTPYAINVKGIPDDIIRFILQSQLDLRIVKKRKCTQAETIVHIIQSYKNLIKK